MSNIPHTPIAGGHEPAGASPDRTLRGIAEVRQFFRTNLTPIYFISPTAFNLLGIDRWVRNLFYITYFDSFEGSHPRVVVPSNRERRDFESIEDVCNHLLRDREILDWMATRGPGGKAAFVMFDEETEALARKAGLEVIHPPAELRARLDSKIVTTQIGNEAGVPSVPNVIDRASSYEELSTIAADASLGDDLVVQTPYGDSGKTTFFIRGQSDWDRHADKLVDGELKVMKRISNYEVCLEASLTSSGTVVGPFMTSLIGYPELTPYKGGWCGNDLFPEALSEAHREIAIEHVRRLGDRLRLEGYRGFFEVDVLVDLDSDNVYLGELNPRISGASSMTNVTAGAYADIPLFLFHLLEFMNIDYHVDVDEINERWRDLAAVDIWAQLIMKEPIDSVERILEAPHTGTWHLEDDGTLKFVLVTNDWHDVTHEDECFYLRVYAPGDYRFKGADLGILVTKGRMQTADGLTERCRRYITGIRSAYKSERLPKAPAVVPIGYVK